MLDSHHLVLKNSRFRLIQATHPMSRRGSIMFLSTKGSKYVAVVRNEYGRMRNMAPNVEEVSKDGRCLL
jgi:hypothetical protein